MNVSPDFSLPLRIIAPYFIGAVIFYIVSIGFLLSITPDCGMRDFRVIGWVHLYMIGFVMMAIIGAMGQLSVVVGDVRHVYPNVFRWIAPLLVMGTIILFFGFIKTSLLLPIGGTVILVALTLFVFNLFATLKKSRRRTAVTESMRWSTLFLIWGLVLGMVMVLGYTGIIPIDPTQWRMGHIFAVFGGYVMLNIMGVSTVLLPMFGACTRPDEKKHAISFYAMIVSVGVMLLASAMQIASLKTIALFFGMSAVIYYMVQVYFIFTSKKRTYSDIWERSVAVAFIALVVSMGSGVYGYFSEDEKAVMLSFWLLAVGFLGFLISAHLYKIVPFLVWFERYAPYIDDREVPMLHQLLPTRLASFQWGLGVIGVVCSAFGLGIENSWIWKIGVLMLAGSGAFLLAVLTKVLRDKL